MPKALILHSNTCLASESSSRRLSGPSGIGAVSGVGWRMKMEKPSWLRHQADHCRQLALGVNDDQTIAALLAMAQEYDERADKVEGKSHNRCID